MQSIIIGLLFIWSGPLVAQSMTLRVLGKTEYHTLPSKYILQIALNDIKDYVLFRQNLEVLGLYLDSLQIEYERKDLEIETIKQDGELGVQILTNSATDYHMLSQKAEQLGINGEPEYEYPPHDYRDEYHLATEAFLDAQHRAQMLAGALGMKIKSVQYIDDQVDRMWFYVNDFPSLRCRTDWATEILDLIDLMFTYNPGEDPGERLSQYAIWVGFELDE